MKQKSYLIFMTVKLRLITLYNFIYECYNTELKWHCQRFSNNGKTGVFTDEELLTCYLFSIIEEDKFLIKKSYFFIKKYWLSWFPKLPSYQSFNKRLNRLSSVLSELVYSLSTLLTSSKGLGCSDGLLDSFPIMLSSGKRKGKVVPELSKKGYCSTKRLYYHGVKCHILGMSRANTIPIPTWVSITSAESHDITPVKTHLHLFRNQRIFAPINRDLQLIKLMISRQLENTLLQIPHSGEAQNCQLLTPEKAVKGEPAQERAWKLAYRNILQRAVSQVRQPIVENPAQRGVII